MRIYTNINAGLAAEHCTTRSKKNPEVGSDLRRTGAQTLDTIARDVSICGGLWKKTINVTTSHSSPIMPACPFYIVDSESVRAPSGNQNSSYSAFGAFKRNSSCLKISCTRTKTHQGLKRQAECKQYKHNQVARKWQGVGTRPGSENIHHIQKIHHNEARLMTIA